MVQLLVKPAGASSWFDLVVFEFKFTDLPHVDPEGQPRVAKLIQSLDPAQNLGNAPKNCGAPSKESFVPFGPSTPKSLGFSEKWPLNLPINLSVRIRPTVQRFRIGRIAIVTRKHLTG